MRSSVTRDVVIVGVVGVLVLVVGLAVAGSSIAAALVAPGAALAAVAVLGLLAWLGLWVLRTVARS